MKKLVVLAVLLMAVPALAAPSNVSISVTKTGPNEFTIGYNTDANLVRAFGLDIIVDDPCVSIDVDCTGNTKYDIYPGSITISGAGVPGPWGQCDVATSDANHVIIEMGSLYEAGVDPAPATSGNLAVVTMTGCDSDDSDGDDTVTVKVEENALRGGVVMENVDEVPNLSSPGGTVAHELGPCDTGCLVVGQTVGGNLITQAMRDVWDGIGQPDCWCYDCHYRCDTDGDCDVDAIDVGVAVAGWTTYTGNECADTDNDGDIDAVDIGAMVTGWNSGCGSCTPI